MEISYHFHNLESSDGLKDYARKKIEKLAAHFNSFHSALVRFRVETKINHSIELTLNGDGVQFIATENGTDMYGIVDMLEEKLGKQIRKHKEKHLGSSHRGERG
ncbi:MAG: ribosome-associated translation inhibitor RaiA [Leptospirales bacterium]|nr:ribosome-associated translation inhibitor RaiA [Leptospirales bacterium]